MSDEASADRQPPQPLKRVCVFCGSSEGREPTFRAAAEAVGTALAKAGMGVVYGGARVGLMGAVADAALAGGAEVIGVLPQGLMKRELAHQGLTALHVVSSMHERKAMMADLSDAFVTLPGGAGTLEEFFEVWTWAQLGFHQKPVALYDVDGFWAPLRSMLHMITDHGFLRQAYTESLMIVRDPVELVAGLRNYVAPPRKWGEAQLKEVGR